MAITAYQVTNSAYQGVGLFAYQGSTDTTSAVIRGGDAGPSEAGKRREYRPFGRAEIERIISEQERLQAQLHEKRFDATVSEAAKQELLEQIEALSVKRKRLEEEEILLLLLLTAAGQIM